MITRRSLFGLAVVSLAPMLPAPTWTVNWTPGLNTAEILERAAAISRVRAEATAARVNYALSATEYLTLKHKGILHTNLTLWLDRPKTDMREVYRLNGSRKLKWKTVI